jgi:hypothetical protein
MKAKIVWMIVVVLVGAAVFAAVEWWIASWFWHPLRGLGYQAWSGILGSFLANIPPWVIAGVVYWKHHNCHEKGCWSIGHIHPGHGWPVCTDHYHIAPAHVTRES